MSPRPSLPLHLEYALLGLIRRQPVHGYELMQQWKDEKGMGLVWSVKPGLLYAALEKLEQHGYIQSALIPGKTSPVRKEYHITPLGEDAFLGWMITPVTHARDFRQDFLYKLYFAQDVLPTSMEVLIRQQQELCVDWIITLRVQLSECSAYDRMVIDFRIRQVQSIHEWLDELSRTISL